MSWETFFSTQKLLISPRILRYIDNLALLHKSTEEAHIDQLRLHAQNGDREESDNANADPFSMGYHGTTMANDDDDVWRLEGNDSTRALAVVQSALEGSLDSDDPYVQEAMEANFANGYFDSNAESETTPVPEQPSFAIDDRSDGPTFTAMDTKLLGKLLKEAEQNEQKSAQTRNNEDVTPGVFSTDSDISSLSRNFSLNTEQSLAFRIICNHAVGHYPPDEPQLLMGVFGEGGTGKSRLINK